MSDIFSLYLKICSWILEWECIGGDTPENSLLTAVTAGGKSSSAPQFLMLSSLLGREWVGRSRGNKKQVRWEQSSVYAERKWERHCDRSDRERVRLHPRGGERVWRCVAALLLAPLLLPSPGGEETASPFPCCTTQQRESVLKWRGVDVKF